jgi:hypothetical protein
MIEQKGTGTLKKWMSRGNTGNLKFTINKKRNLVTSPQIQAPILPKKERRGLSEYK